MTDTKKQYDLLEFTISGSYKTSGGEVVDFENVKGTVPKCDEEIATMHVRSRYAARWIREAKNADGEALYPERIERVRQVHIDDIKAAKGPLSFVGKDIKEMNFEELQDLATVKDLRRIPLYKAQDLRQSRTMAFVDYSESVLGTSKIKHQAEDFNFAKLTGIVVPDANPRRDETIKLDNEDVINAETNKKQLDSNKSQLSMSDLHEMAKKKNIKVDPHESYDQLYQKLYA